MAFRDGYRLEKVYFENIYTLLNTLKSMKGSEVNFDTVRELLDNAIADNESIIIIYKNLGELYNEVSIRFTELDKTLKDLRNQLEEWKDEINDKIDEVNNYIMTFIREILQRLDVIEADLAQMGRVLTYDITRVNAEWELKEQNTAVTFAQTATYFTHERPHLVLVRGELNGEVTYLFPREYDTNSSTGIFEWYTMGFVGNEIHEVTVTLLPDNSVNVAVQTTDFATINQRLATAEQDIDNLEGRMDTAEDDIDALEGRMTTAEGDIDALEQRMTTAEGDIDTLEQTAENHDDRITDLETCCDDMQDNVIPQIQQSLAGKQEKLVAGSGISIDPVTNEIENTAQGATYTAGKGLGLANNEFSNKYVFPYYDTNPVILASHGLVLNALSIDVAEAYFTTMTSYRVANPLMCEGYEVTLSPGNNVRSLSSGTWSDEFIIAMLTLEANFHFYNSEGRSISERHYIKASKIGGGILSSTDTKTQLNVRGVEAREYININGWKNESLSLQYIDLVLSADILLGGTDTAIKRSLFNTMNSGITCSITGFRKD